ncbi:MAG: AI-2E family transporter [Parvibaculaceae bacterium]
MALRFRQRLQITPALHPYPSAVSPREMLDWGAKASLILLGLIALIVALDLGTFLLAPVVGAVVVGLMLGPLVTRMERHGVPSALSAFAALLFFLLILCALVASIAVPAAAWAERIPEMWAALKSTASSMRESLKTVTDLGRQLRTAAGVEDGTLTVSTDTLGITSFLTLAPPIIGQIVLFIATLYFFLATRTRIRTAVLTLCVGRAARCRAARIFRDVEHFVSRYLLAITAVNAGLGAATAVGLWLIGIPSPFLWGALAMVLNFVPFVGPAVFAVIIFAVGLVTYETHAALALPPLVALGVHFVEAQFVTPSVIGRAMTLNPLLVFLSLAFWIWVWGPLGGFIAVPLLLIMSAVTLHVLPRKEAAARRYAARPAGQPIRFRSGTAKISMRSQGQAAVKPTTEAVRMPVDLSAGEKATAPAE